MKLFSRRLQTIPQRLLCKQQNKSISLDKSFSTILPKTIHTPTRKSRPQLAWHRSRRVLSSCNIPVSAGSYEHSALCALYHIWRRPAPVSGLWGFLQLWPRVLTSGSGAPMVTRWTLWHESESVVCSAQHAMMMTPRLIITFRREMLSPDSSEAARAVQWSGYC